MEVLFLLLIAFPELFLFLIIALFVFCNFAAIVEAVKMILALILGAIIVWMAYALAKCFTDEGM